MFWQLLLYRTMAIFFGVCSLIPLIPDSQDTEKEAAKKKDRLDIKLITKMLGVQVSEGEPSLKWSAELTIHAEVMMSLDDKTTRPVINEVKCNPLKNLARSKATSVLDHKFRFGKGFQENSTSKSNMWLILGSDSIATGAH